MDSGFQVLDSSFCEWNLDSGFQSLVGLRIPCVIFRIPTPKIPDSTSKTFPDFGFHKHIFPEFRNPLHESSLRVTLGTYIVHEPSAEKWQIVTTRGGKCYQWFFESPTCLDDENVSFRNPQKNFPNFGIRIPRHGTKSRRSLHFVVVYA